MTRVAATESVKAFYGEEMRDALGSDGPLERLRARLPDGFEGWGDLERAAWLEVTTLLEPYLLAAQGDRVAMAHGVEGRYPFLDHRMYALSVGLPAAEKLTQESDKVALRRLAAEVLPAEIAERGKQPYRAPEVDPLLRARRPRLGRRGALARGDRAGRDLGRAAGSRGSCAAAARGGRRGCARAWPSSASSRPSSGTRRSSAATRRILPRRPNRG